MTEGCLVCPRFEPSTGRLASKIGLHGFGWRLGCSCWWVCAFIHSIFIVKHSMLDIQWLQWWYNVYMFIYISHSIILRHQVVSPSLLIPVWGSSFAGFLPKNRVQWRKAPENRSHCNDMEEFNLRQAHFPMLCCASGPFSIPFLKWIGRKTKVFLLDRDNGICICRQRSNEALDFAAKSGTVV